MRKGEVASLSWSEVEGDVAHAPRCPFEERRRPATVPLVGEASRNSQASPGRAAQVEENGTVRIVKLFFHRDGAPVAEFRKSLGEPLAFAAGIRKNGLPHLPGTRGPRRTVRESARPKHSTVVGCSMIFRRSGRSRHGARQAVPLPLSLPKKSAAHKPIQCFQRYSILITDDFALGL